MSEVQVAISAASILSPRRGSDQDGGRIYCLSVQQGEGLRRLLTIFTVGGFSRFFPKTLETIFVGCFVLHRDGRNICSDPYSRPNITLVGVKVTSHLSATRGGRPHSGRIRGTQPGVGIVDRGGEGRECRLPGADLPQDAIM